MEQSHRQVERILVGLAIEHTLLNIDRPVFEKVQRLLQERYGSSFVDSCDHPEYLREILAEVFGSSYKDVIKSIKAFLADFTTQYPIQEFVTKVAA